MSFQIIKSSKIKSFSSQVLTTAATHILLMIVGLCNSLLVARLLGPEGRGILEAFFLIPIFLSSIGLFSMANGVIYYSGKDVVNRSIYQSSFLIFGLFIATLYAITLLIGQRYIWHVIIHELNYSWVLASVIPLATFLYVGNNAANNILLSKRDVIKYNIATIITPSVKLALILPLLCISVVNRTNWIILSTVFSLFATSLILFYNLRPVYTLRTINFQYLTKMFKFSIKSYWGDVLQKLNLVLDKFIIAVFLPPRELGYYAISVLLAQLVWFVPSAINPIVMPYASAVLGRDAEEKLNMLARITLWGSAGVAFAICILLPLIIRYGFGEAFLPSIGPCYILLPGAIAMSHTKILSRIITGRGYPTSDSIASACSFIITIFLLSLLLPKYGIYGAAISTTLAYIVYNSILLLYFKKQLGIRLKSILLPSMYDIAFFRSRILEKFS